MKENQSNQPEESPALGKTVVMPRPCPFCGENAQFREGNEHSYTGGTDVTLILECVNCPAEMTTIYDKSNSAGVDKLSAVKYLTDSWNKAAVA